MTFSQNPIDDIHIRIERAEKALKEKKEILESLQRMLQGLRKHEEQASFQDDTQALESIESQLKAL